MYESAWVYFIVRIFLMIKRVVLLLNLAYTFTTSKKKLNVVSYWPLLYDNKTIIRIQSVIIAYAQCTIMDAISLLWRLLCADTDIDLDLLFQSISVYITAMVKGGG